MAFTTNDIEIMSYDEDTQKAIAQAMISCADKLSQPKPKYLLEGKPYTNAAATDIRNTFRKFGWVPPSEVRK